MAIGNKIISFWKQVRVKSSDMFTLFKVGVGIKSPTHKLHVKDTTDPMKLEGVQSDTSSSTKLLVLDSDNVIKHGTITNLSAAGVSGADNQLLTDDGDGTITSNSTFTYDGSSRILELGGDTFNAFTIKRKAHSDNIGGDVRIYGGNAGGTNRAGGDIEIYSGKGTGSAAGGAIKFYVSTAGSSGDISHLVQAVDMTITDGQVAVAGNITVTGTVDGRDVATDGSKLDGIEASADVTDTANVTAAGALMDSELTDLAGVKGVTISTLQVKPSEGAFANGDKTKLDAIEASADVTDTANVTAAGALMDSEVTNLSQVKAFDSSDYATAAQGAKADSAQQPPSEGAFANGDKTKLDAIESGATADQTQADINGLGITALGIAGATDGDVTITSDGHVTVKLDSDNDESNQRFLITNNADASVFHVQEDGNVFLAGTSITNSGSDNDLTLETDGSLTFTIDRDNDETGQNWAFVNYNTAIATLDESGVFAFHPSNTLNGTITATRRLFLQHGSTYDVSIGDATNTNVLQVQGSDEIVKVNGTLQLPDNAIVGKQREIYSQSFLDDLGTTKHYLPWKDINEQTTIYQEEAAMLMPCDGRIVSVTVKVMSITGNGDMTIGVNTIAPNINAFGSANWTEEETETLSIASTDDYHVFHFAFDNAKHFDSGDLVTISMQNDTDLSSTTYWYVSTVVEYDWSTFLGTTSGEHDSNP